MGTLKITITVVESARRAAKSSGITRTLVTITERAARSPIEETESKNGIMILCHSKIKNKRPLTRLNKLKIKTTMPLQRKAKVVRRNDQRTKGTTAEVARNILDTTTTKKIIIKMQAILRRIILVPITKRTKTKVRPLLSSSSTAL